MLNNPDADSAPLLCDRALRRQIDRCIGRALLEPEYASLLLSEPTLLLEDYNCPPQDYLSLQSITASCLVDFAKQAKSLFWLGFSPTANSGVQNASWPRSGRVPDAPLQVARS